MLTNTITLRNMIIMIGTCVAISSCNMPVSEGSAAFDATEIPPSAHTASAVLTDIASNPITSEPPTATLHVIELIVPTGTTSTPTSTMIPTETMYYQIQSVPKCDMAGFVSDVTIPDGTEIEANSSFTKTWELRNDGTCTWNSNYDLVFSSGDLMSGDDAVSIGDDSVSPGETIEVSIELVAPEEPGNYIGYWMLRNDSDTVFGLGSGNYAFFVDINVVEAQATSTPTVTTTPNTPTNTPEVSPTPSSTDAPATPTATATPALETSTPTATEEPETPTPTSTPTSTATTSPGN